MFEGGSLWKPPPLKNLRSKILLPPLDEDIIRGRGQLSTRSGHTHMCVMEYNICTHKHKKQEVRGTVALPPRFLKNNCP